MSTNAVIAKKDGDFWKGVYHHWDGYPTGLGCYIFREIRYKFNGDVAAFIKDAIDDHTGGWSTLFPSTDLKTGENRRFCYCHTGDEGPSELQTPEIVNQLFIAWVYVLDPQKNTMTILGHKRVSKLKPGQSGHAVDGGYYVHFEKAKVVLSGPEPDWWAIEGRKRKADDHSFADDYYAPIIE